MGVPSELQINEVAKAIFVDSKTISERLLQLSVRTGYNCIQRNGQRYYGPPPNWNGSPPERGSEVFVGRLPRDLFEDELVPIFESVAPLYEVRMMMNFTGYNRGFSFVTYCNPNDAWKAVMRLNSYEIRPGHKIVVSKSVDNCRLYIGGVPQDKNKTEVWDEILKICSTVKEVIMYPNPADRKKNRGFLFAEFDSHRSAAMAKRMMATGTVKLWDRDVIVDWAVPEPEIDPNIMATITKLFIRNFTVGVDGEFIHCFLRDVLPASAIQRIYVAGHYGFVHFDTRAHAQHAKEKLSLVRSDGEPLEVHWARPKYYKKAITAYSKHRRNSVNNALLPNPVGDQPFVPMQPLQVIVPKKPRQHVVPQKPLQHIIPQQPLQQVGPQQPPLQQIGPQQPLQCVVPPDVNNNFEIHEPAVRQFILQYPAYTHPPIVYTPNPVSFYHQ